MATSKRAKMGVPASAGFAFVGEARPWSGGEVFAPDAPPETEAAPPPAGMLRRVMGDGAVALMKGAVAVPEAAVGLADMATGGRVGRALEEGVDVGGVSLGFRPKEAKQALDTMLTPEQQAANKAVQEAEGFLETTMAALRNPSVVLSATAESLPSMGAGGVVGRALMKMAPAGGLGARIGAGAAGEGIVAAGSQAESIRQETPDGLLTGTQSAIAAGSGAATGLLGLLGGQVARRMGIADVDTILVGKGAPDVTKGFARRVLEGAVAEGLLEELPQSVQEQVAQNLALDRPLGEGVPQAAVLGALSGGLMGGVFNAPGAGSQIRREKPVPTGPVSAAAGAGLEAAATQADELEAAAQRAAAAAGVAPAVEPQSVVSRDAQPVAPTRTPEEIEAGLGQWHQDAAREVQDVGKVWNEPRRDIPPAPPAIVTDGPVSDANPEPLPGDVLNTEGKPFTNKRAALEAQKRQADPESVVLAKVRGGFTLRPRPAQQVVQEQPQAAGDAGAPAPEPTPTTTAAPEIDAAAHEAASSPLNDLPDPTDAQKEAGNYKVGRVRISGMDVSIETPKGAERRSKADAPEPWKVTMPAHYGYIRGTKGADGDHVDLFVGDKGDNGRFWVVNQTTPDGKKLDEHKVITGVDSADEAVALYKASFADGFGDKVFGSVSTEFDADGIKGQLPKMKKPRPVAPAPVPDAAAPAQEAPAQARVPDAAAPGQGVMPAGLRVTFGGKTYPVESIEDAQRKWIQFQESADGGGPAGVSQVGNGVPIIDGAGRLVARVAFNGRAFDPEDNVIAEAPAPAAAPSSRPPTLMDRMTEAAGGPVTFGDIKAMDEAAAAPLKSRGFNENGPGPGEWVLPVSNLGDVIAKVVSQPGEPLRVEISADFGGKRLDTRTAEGDAAIDEAIQRARDGINEGRERMAREVRAKESGVSSAAPTPALPAANEGDAYPERWAVSTWASAPAEQREQFLLAAGWKKGSEGIKAMEDKAWDAMTPSQKSRIRVAIQAAEQAPVKQQPVAAPSVSTAPAPAAAAPSSTPAAAPKRSKAAQAAAAARRANLERYFAPGNIVKSYGGHDEVLGLKISDDGGFSVHVHAVTKSQGSGQWVRLGKPQDARSHSTFPDARELKAGPVAQLMHVPGELVSYTEGRADGQPFKNAPDRGVAPAPAPAAAPADGTKVVGRRADGVMIREDERGVRFYSEDGFRHFETVSMRPTANGVKPVRGELKPDWMTAEEAAAAAPAAAPSPKPSTQASAEPSPKASPKASPNPSPKPPIGEAPKPSPKPSANTVFTEDAAAAARALLKRKLGGTLNSGIDPEVLQAGITLAGYHIEKGARTFAAYAKAMLEDLGDSVKPYLKSWYMGVKYDPRAAGWEGMDSAAAVEAAGLDDSTETGTAPAPEQAQNEPQEKPDDPPASTPAPTVDQPVAEGQRPQGSEQPARGARQPRARARRADDRGVRGQGGLFEGVDDAGQDLGNGRGDDAVSDRPDDGVAGGVRGVSARDFRPALGGLKREGSWFDTAKRNLDLIDLARKIDSEGRQATPEEQAELVKYVGFGAGAIRNAMFPAPSQWQRQQEPGRLIFPDSVYEARWKPLAERAAELPIEWQRSILQTTQYQHFTSEGIIRSIWSGMQRLGFTGGKVFEPGTGIGSFSMLMPDGVRKTSKFTGIEFDGPTALIARLLSPEQHMLHDDFIKRKLPGNFFDVVVGNPPFSQTKILGDPDYEKYGFMLHDFFFAKAMDKLRPGGILAFVTSKGTMDKQTDKARKYLSERADLLGAIRLPSVAFEDNAGTSVVTDVIFLRKRLPGEQAAGEAWSGVATVETPDGPVVINEYFAAHPEMVLGQNRISGNTDDKGRRINSNGYGGERYTVVSYDESPEALEAKFAAAIERLPENAYSPLTQAAPSVRAEVAKMDFDPKVRREGVVYVKDGALMRVENGVGSPLESAVKLSDKDKAWLKSYVGLRELVQEARHAQVTDGDWQAALKKLNAAYDKFLKDHGPINAFRTMVRKSTDEEGNVVESTTRIFTNRRLFREDYDNPIVAQLEVIDEDGAIKKAPFLRDRTIGKPVTREVKTIGDALAVSLDGIGRLDLDDVASRLGITRADAIEALGPQVYKTPQGEWQLADEYLSGDVVAKLAEAIDAARLDESLRRNVEALKEVQPEKLGPSQISVKLGASWVPAEHVNAFAKEIEAGAVTFDPKTESWQVAGGNERSQRKAGAEYGTAARSPSELLEAVLNSRSIKVMTRVPNDSGTGTKDAVDQEATTAANEAAKKIKDKFKSWVWTDSERAADLVERYNERFNNIAPRRFDGSHLTLPGVSLRFKLHAHQLRAIWRQIQTGNTYLAHAVGAGKTIEMIAGGMEQKRLGLVRKPMYVVPNHMLEQFANEFMELYPLANIMVADDQNFSKERRKAFVAAATLNAPDAIVITHDAFQRIGVKEESVAPIRDEILSDLQDELDDAAKDKGARVRRGQLEQQIEAVTQRFDSIVAAGKKDGIVSFEEMGVDKVFVDEAHTYRKLDFHTAQSIKGIDPNGSRRALDMYVKTRWLDRQRPGRSFTFASGTPVTNTMGELFTILRFFAPDMLNKGGISTFDAWARMFGEVVPALEPNASGKYEIVERFARFDNVPELMSRVRQFMDVLQSDQLGAVVKRPDLEGGKPNLIVVEPTKALKAYQEGELSRRLEASRAWKPSKDEPNNPDPVIAIITDGRFAATDPRFIPYVTKVGEGETTKMDRAADEIAAEYKATADNEYVDRQGKPMANKGGTQVVFYNVGFGAEAGAKRGFDARGTFTRRLVSLGIKREHIAWFDDADTDAKKEAIFKAMRSGSLRVLIGSAKKMGTGVNVQNRLTSLHYMDPPWFPADVEQPHGRIIRQGNQNAWVRIKWYATKGGYDSTMWQMVGRKQRFIDQAFSGDKNLRSMDDLGEASLYEQAAALASGDPRAIQLAGLRQDVERFERLQAAHANEQINARTALSSAEWNAKNADDRARTYKKALEVIGGYFAFSEGKVKGRAYTKHGEFGEALKAAFNEVAAEEAITPTEKAHEIGSIGKLPITVTQGWQNERNTKTKDIELKPTGYLSLDVMAGTFEINVTSATALGSDTDGAGLTRRLVNAVNDVDRKLRTAQDDKARNETDIARLRKKIGAPFEHQQEMLDKHGALKALEEELRLEGEAAKAAAAAQRNAAQQQPAPDADEEGEASLKRGAGAGLDLASAQALADRLAADGLIKVNVVASVADLPAQPKRWVKAMAPDGRVRGAYLRGTDQVWAFVDNIRSADEFVNVVLHEGFHRGLAATIPDAKPLLRQMHRTNAALREATAAQMKAHGISQDEAIEEALADMASAGKVRDLSGWDKLLQLIRDWLGKVASAAGLKMEWTDDMVADFVAGITRQGLRAGHVDTQSPGARLQRVFHGTPHRGIERFSTDHIGSGEGAQAYGWGLYFASKREVADYYRIELSAQQRGDTTNWQFNGRETSLNNHIQSAPQRHPNLEAKDAENAAFLASEYVQGNRETPSPEKLQANAIGRAIAQEMAGLKRADGQLYEVGIPEDSEMLLWDKPVRDMPEAVREAIYGAAQGRYVTGASGERRFMSEPDANMSGGAAYARISRLLGGDMAASQALLAAGVKGIKYLDGTSRDAGDGSYNYVIFNGEDVADVTPRLSRSFAGVMNDVREFDLPAKYKVGDFLNSDGRIHWWHKTVGTMHNLAERSPLFKRVYDAVQAFVGDVSYYATEAADLAPRILPKLEHWRDITKSPLSPEDTKAVAAPIFEGTLKWVRTAGGDLITAEEAERQAAAMSADEKAQELLRQGRIEPRVLKMWQGMPLEQYEAAIDTKYEKEVLQVGVVWSPAELRARFNLSSEQIELYQEFRRAVDKSLTNMAISDMLRDGGADVAALRSRALASDDVMAVGRMLRDHLWALADATPDRASVLNDSGRKAMEKAERAQSLMKRGYAPLTRFGQYTLDVVDTDGERVYFGLFETAAERARMARQMRGNFPGATVETGTVSQEAYRLFAGVGPETLEIFGEFMGLSATGSDASSKAFQQYIKLTKSTRSAMRRLIQRKGIEGYSEDVGRVLAGFVYSNARQTASNLHMGEITEAVAEIPKGEGQLQDAAVKLSEYVKNPQEEAQTIRGWLFAQYLGGSVASALVNMTQPATVTFPYLSQFGGAAKAAKRIGQAARLAGKDSTGDAALDRALHRAEELGIVAPQEVHQLQAQAMGRATLRSGDGTTVGNAAAWGSNKLSLMGFAWGKLFGMAEQVNRRVTFIAAYRTAVEQGMPDPDEFAKRAVTETQFTYNKGNKPRWARGAVGSVLFTFKQYSISYVELMNRMWNQGAEGSPEREAGRKAVMLAMAVLLLAGGGDGLPFMQDAEDVVDGVLQRLGFNFSTKQAKREFLARHLGDAGAQFVLKGVSGLPGVPIDVSGRMGMGNLLPGTGLLTKKPDHTRDLLEVAGPAGDLASRAFKAAGQLVDGTPGKAIETIAPTAARNVAKAVDMAATGMYRDDRGRKVIDVDAADVLAKAASFQPNDVARVQEATFTTQRMISQVKMREAEIADMMAVAIFEGDKEKLADARAALARWNGNNPTSRIAIQMPQVLKRVRAMRASKAERIAKTAPREIRAQVRAELAGAEE